MAIERTREEHGSDPALRQVVERFGDASRDFHVVRDVVRDEILSSWQRSVGAGLRHDLLDVPYDGDVDDTGRLRWAAVPVIDQIANDLDEARVGLLLTDHRAHVVDRRSGTHGDRPARSHRPGTRLPLPETLVGTNAIGTALETSAPSIVLGQEHFADALIGTACTAAPVVDPSTGRVIGIVDLTSAAGDANALMLPLAKRAAWEIEQRLLDAASKHERILHEHCVGTADDQDSNGGDDDSSMLVNGPAAGLLQASDRGPLWDAVSAHPREALEVALANGRTVAIRSEAVVEGDHVIGALIRLHATQGTDVAGADRHGPDALRSGGRACPTPNVRWRT